MSQDKNMSKSTMTKVQRLRNMQEEHESILQELEKYEMKLQSAKEAQEYINNIDEEDMTVHRSIDDLIFEIDYDVAEEHINNKVENCEAKVDELQEKQEELQEEMEKIGAEVQNQVNNGGGGDVGL